MNDAAKALTDQELTIEGRLFKVTAVEERPASPSAPGSPATPAFTRLEIRAAPALRIDLALPEEWNGRLYVHGNGGFAGEGVDSPLRDPQRAQGLTKGFAVAGSNTGHDDTVDILGGFASDSDKLLDYAHRAVHQTALVAKELLARIYGNGPHHSYFEGCSTGGRQAIMAAQRYPDDFDGIVCGAPVLDFTGSQLWGVKTGQILEGSGIGDAQMRIVAKALRDKCVAENQIEDGLIVDALHLDFDVMRDVPISQNGSEDSLTPDQAKAFAAVYGSADIGGGRTFPGMPFGAEFIGTLMPGLAPASGWAGWFYRWDAGFFMGAGSGVRATFGETFLHYFLGYRGSWKDFDFSDEALRGVGEVSALMDAVDPDLAPFANAKSKLIMYHGLADAALNPARAAAYFEDVRSTMGADKVDEFARLYLVPGMFHCFGGYGPSLFDMLSPLVAWVENGTAPEAIPAVELDFETGMPKRTRNLCAYPCVSRYCGSGDLAKAEAFDCVSE